MPEPETTRLTLLARLKDPADPAAWREFDDTYRDLLVAFCRRRGLQPADADDVVQTVFAGLVRSMPGFIYDRNRGRFRDYLYRCVRNAISQRAARPQSVRLALGTDSGMPLDAAGASDPEAEAVWESEWVAHHYRRALAKVRESFDEKSVAIFEATVAGATAASVAERFGSTEQAVHKVRQRIRKRLEAIIAEQIREEDEPVD